MKALKTKTLAGLFLLAAACNMEAQYSYTTLDAPGGLAGTYAVGVYGSTVIGSYSDADDNSHGFLYDAGTHAYTDLSHPDAVYTYLAGISGSVVLGYYYDGSSEHPFLYNTGSSDYTSLSLNLGAAYTQAYGIFGNTIVGNYADEWGGNEHAFLYDVNTDHYTVLNDSPLSDGHGTSAYGFFGNYVVGSAYDSDDGNPHGFLYNINTDTYTILDAVESVIGVSGNYVLGELDGQYSLYDINNSTYTSLDDLPDATYGGVSEDSSVVGSFSDENGDHGFLGTPSPVPEPSSFALAAFGTLSGFYFIRRRSLRTAA